MPCGLFGKLPAKRDFVALSAPREFLKVWETWLQAAISGSRVTLAEDWREAFLRAPIWRFWLGADVCGVTVAGAFMPSVDGVGRYFPLTVFAGLEHIPPPELDPQEAWFAAAEEFLLSALATDSTFERLSEALARLPPPLDGLVKAPPEQMTRLADGSIALPTTPADLPAALADIRVEDYTRAYAGSTYWWTSGGEGFAPFVLSGKHMPSPYVFTGMLTGRFEHLFS
jgi:type VI secretion system protein ImpM